MNIKQQLILLIAFSTIALNVFAQKKGIIVFTLKNAKTQAIITNATLVNISNGENHSVDKQGIIKCNVKTATFNYKIVADGYKLYEGFTKIIPNQSINVPIALEPLTTATSEAQGPAESYFELNGFVTDNGNGQPLKNVLVTVGYDTSVVKTNAKGFYTYTSKLPVKYSVSKEPPAKFTTITYNLKGHKLLVKKNILVLPTATRYSVSLIKGIGTIEN
jgi:hypothetical protein